MRKEKHGERSILNSASGKGAHYRLPSNILQSPTLNKFFGTIRQSSDALSEQFQRLLTVSRSEAVAGSMSATYCFWRIQQELLHPMYAEQLPSWYSVQEALLDILTELQQGAPEDQICSGLQGLFGMMQRKLGLVSRSCMPTLAKYILR
jgi:hypothetical protein